MAHGGQNGQMRGEILSYCHGFDGTGPENQSRHAERQSQQGQQGAAAPRPQGERSGQSADQRERRRPDKKRGRERQEAGSIEAEGDAQEGRQDDQRQAGHNPVSRALGQRRELERPGRQQQQVERAVLVVGREQAIERQQRGEEGGAPQDTRGDARQQVGLGADAERKQHGRYDEEGEHDGDIARTPPDKAQVTRNQSGEAAHACSSRELAVIPRSAWVAAIARPPAARCFCRTTRNAACAGASSAFSGSSSSQIGAWLSTTLAKATRRRWPADSAPRRRSATRRFSRTERSPLRPSRWPSQASRPRQVSGSARTSAPCQRTVPASGRTSRASARRSVVLPLPLRPVSAKSSPAPKAKDRWSKTRRPPRRQARSVTSRRGGAIGAVVAWPYAGRGQRKRPSSRGRVRRRPKRLRRGWNVALGGPRSGEIQPEDGNTRWPSLDPNRA